MYWKYDWKRPLYNKFKTEWFFLAEGAYRKLLVNVNEAESKDTFQNEGQFKSFITEDTIVVNPKYVRPTKIANHARLIITSNKPNPIPIDVKSKDRR